MNGQRQNTTSDTESRSLIKYGSYDTTLDEYMTRVCLDRTMGDVVHSREVATNAKQYTVASMIFNAVFEMDVDLIRTIALRIDGTVPAEDQRDGYANIIGDAIEDVLSYGKVNQLQITPSDKPVIAMAKALIFVATQTAGANYAKRKERNLAAQMILERTGGRKVEPSRPLIETVYEDPEWLQLPGGKEDDHGRPGEETHREA